MQRPCPGERRDRRLHPCGFDRRPVAAVVGALVLPALIALIASSGCTAIRDPSVALVAERNGSPQNHRAHDELADGASSAANRYLNADDWILHPLASAAALHPHDDAREQRGAGLQTRQVEPLRSDTERKLRFEAHQSEAQPFSLQSLGRDTGNERFRLVASTTGFEGSNFAVETKVTDATRAEDRTAERWIRDDPFAGGFDTITSTLLTANAFDDRVKLKSAVAFSQFHEDRGGAANLEDFDTAFGPGPSAGDVEEGLATWHSLDVDLLRGGTRISAFTRASSAEQAFEGDSLSKRERRFGKPGEDRFSYGATVGWRPLDVTVTGKQRSRSDEDAEWSERSVNASAYVSTAELARLFGAATATTGASKLLPESIWGSYESGTVDPAPAASTADAFKSLSFGLTWSLGSFYATWGYWNYVYDGERAGGSGTDWVGEGSYVSGGYAARRWSADVYAGWNGSDNQERYARSASSNLDGGLRLSYTPVNLPDLDVSVSAGQYAEDYIAYGYETGTALYQFGAELDFAKFVPALRDQASALSLFYWTESVGYSDDLREDTIETDHVIGLRYSRPLQ